jgi:hypothetical protein
MEDEEIEEETPYISGSGEGLMEEAPTSHASARRDEDIALDLMKFIAMTTGYGPRLALVFRVRARHRSPTNTRRNCSSYTGSARQRWGERSSEQPLRIQSLLRLTEPQHRQDIGKKKPRLEPRSPSQPNSVF